MANSAGDWGPSKPTAIPDLIMELKRRGHSRDLIRRVVFENPRKFFSQSKNFKAHTLHSESASS
jgi:Predicted metal-dependent hydrolases with the TIM-barrel fold